MMRILRTIMVMSVYMHQHLFVYTNICFISRQYDLQQTKFRWALPKTNRCQCDRVLVPPTWSLTLIGNIHHCPFPYKTSETRHSTELWWFVDEPLPLLNRSNWQTPYFIVLLECQSGLPSGDMCAGQPDNTYVEAGPCSPDHHVCIGEKISVSKVCGTGTVFNNDCRCCKWPASTPSCQTQQEETTPEHMSGNANLQSTTRDFNVQITDSNSEPTTADAANAHTTTKKTNSKTTTGDTNGQKTTTRDTTNDTAAQKTSEDPGVQTTYKETNAQTTADNSNVETTTGTNAQTTTDNSDVQTTTGTNAQTTTDDSDIQTTTGTKAQTTTDDSDVQTTTGTNAQTTTDDSDIQTTTGTNAQTTTDNSDVQTTKETNAQTTTRDDNVQTTDPPVQQTTKDTSGNTGNVCAGQPDLKYIETAPCSPNHYICKDGKILVTDTCQDGLIFSNSCGCCNWPATIPACQ